MALAVGTWPSGSIAMGTGDTVRCGGTAASHWTTLVRDFKEEAIMKTFVLLALLTLGIVTIGGCHWNHRHHHNDYRGSAWR